MHYLLADPRGSEALPLVEAGRHGHLRVCTSAGVLSEVYAALTWTGGPSPHAPQDAARVVANLVEPPSAITVLPDGLDPALSHLRWAGLLGLTARRIHDARHAATALHHGVRRIYTYDPDDWLYFAECGLTIAGPPSTLARLGARV